MGHCNLGTNARLLYNEHDTNPRSPVAFGLYNKTMYDRKNYDASYYRTSGVGIYDASVVNYDARSVNYDAKVLLDSNLRC